MVREGAMAMRSRQRRARRPSGARGQDPQMGQPVVGLVGGPCRPPRRRCRPSSQKQVAGVAKHGAALGEGAEPALAGRVSESIPPAEMAHPRCEAVDADRERAPMAFPVRGDKRSDHALSGLTEARRRRTRPITTRPQSAASNLGVNCTASRPGDSGTRPLSCWRRVRCRRIAFDRV